MHYHMGLGALDAITRGLREAPDETRRLLAAAMHQATLLVLHEAQENMPRASGDAWRSIGSEVHSTPAGVLGVVGSASPVAAFVELGTKPHMPPIDAIQPWVKAVLGIADPKENRRVAYLVARKIAAHGTEAKRPLGRAAEAMQPQVVRLFEDAAAQIAQRLVGGQE
ncbi:HK97 gp10 family phage protein [Vandammella animalimorsus]|uniref:HK97 gp10 family phage protein n=1 Tax=Vandammella animalimorsus TaxID=2029117 RepID=A0A3M6RV19_9BURK|nr:HK97 gp10 family phage protein [Vandammella animalimorsus]